MLDAEGNIQYSFTSQETYFCIKKDKMAFFPKYFLNEIVFLP